MSGVCNGAAGPPNCHSYEVKIMKTLVLSRRAAMKWAVAAPVFGATAAREITGKLSAAVPQPASIEVYRRIGVRPKF